MILLPVNVVRLAQIYQLGRSVAHSDGEGLSIQNLRPFMTRRDLPARTTLITKGEWADKLYYLMEGQLEIVELGKSGCLLRIAGAPRPLLFVRPTAWSTS